MNGARLSLITPRGYLSDLGLSQVSFVNFDKHTIGREAHRCGTVNQCIRCVYAAV